MRRTVEEAPTWLVPNGWLLMETDPDRARDVRKVMAAGGFRDVAIHQGRTDPDHARDRGEVSAVTTVAPFGAWPSPISAEMLATTTIGLGEATIEDGVAYWLEMPARPRAAGSSWSRGDPHTRPRT